MLSHLALRLRSTCVARLLLRAATIAIVLLAGALPAASEPPDFVIESATPNAGFNNPVAIAFTPDGRMLVAEKRGVVRVVVNGAKLTRPLWSGETEVLSNGDRGVLGIAVDPDFANNRWIYLLYVVDPDSNGVDNDDDAFGRLVRYQTDAADPDVLDPATREVLIGATWGEGFVSAGSSHAVGALRWGADGSLLVAWGDGAQYAYADAGGHDPNAFLPGRFDPDLDIGAFRAQYLGSINGKILRVDPATGGGYPSNPFFDGDPRSNRSRVWASGMRNPFRFARRPGTGSADPADGEPGTLYIGDVGWNQWDELNVSSSGGENFGWPCYEGLANTPYQNATPSHHGCDSLGTPDNPRLPTPATMRISLLDPANSEPAGLDGRCTIGGVFYTGTVYPSAWRHRYFFADYVGGWIKTATFDENDSLLAIGDFAADIVGPVDFAVEPASGDIHFVSLSDGAVHRIRYTGPLEGNTPPVARASASDELGPAPLTIHFSSFGSSDADLDSLAFAWNFGDGASSMLSDPQHTYATAGYYAAILTVTDGRGGLARDTLSITAISGASFPSTAVLDDFERPDGAIGSSWVGSLSGLRLVGGALTQTSASSYAIWDGAIFGPEQEVHAAFDAVTDSAEHSLLLKVQGRTWTAGHVKIQYDTKYKGAIVLTYDPAIGWKRIGNPVLFRLGPGERLGGRVDSVGNVRVFENDSLRGTISVASWRFATSGGRVGMILARAQATRMTEYGGGDLVTIANQPPAAIVDAPAPNTFFVAGDTLHLAGSGTDLEDPAPALLHRWEIDLHHNTHVHPGYILLDGANPSFVPEQHDDGTGVWMRARLITTDSGGLSDTASVDLHPEIDLRTSTVGTVPTQPGTDVPTEYRFTLDNYGAMPSPWARWRLIADQTTLAEGDTLVPAYGRVFVSVTLPPLESGPHDLRIAVDTLDAVYETDESNNGETRTVEVVAGEGVLDVATLPRVLALSQAWPNPTRGGVKLALDLPRAADVEVAVFDVQGRDVWRAPSRHHPAGRWTLAWSARTHRGERVGAGLYLARVRVEGREMVRRIAVIR